MKILKKILIKKEKIKKNFFKYIFEIQEPKGQRVSFMVGQKKSCGALNRN
jgi:hypothetical protein